MAKKGLANDLSTFDQKRVTEWIIECWVKRVNDPTFDNLRIWLNSALNNLFTSYNWYMYLLVSAAPLFVYVLSSCA